MKYLSQNKILANIYVYIHMHVYIYIKYINTHAHIYTYIQRHTYFHELAISHCQSLLLVLGAGVCLLKIVYA